MFYVRSVIWILFRAYNTLFSLSLKLLVANSEALDDLQFNPTQIDVLTNVVGALAEVAKIQVISNSFENVLIFQRI